MSKTNKILISVLCFAIVVAMSATVFATSIGPVTVSSDTSGNGASQASTIGNKVIGILQVVGILVSVIVLMIIGIKYMMGSAEEKSEYKKTFIPYIVGALLVFAASAFAKMIYEWVTGISL